MEKFFILGNPRSGTSLLRLMLNAHPQIVVPPESGFLQWWYVKYKNWTIECNYLEKVDEFLRDLKTSKKIETWKIDYEKLRQEILSQAPANYGDLISLVYIMFGKQRGKEVDIIGDKNNYYIFHLTELKDIWPDAKFIFMVRDGRDVACSYIAVNQLSTDSPYKPKFPATIDLIATEWIENNGLILNFFSNNPQLHYETVRYEDLICDTVTTLESLCSFLKIKFHPKMLEYYISNKINKDEPESTLDWKLKTMEKPDPINIGKYASHLSQDDISKFNDIATDLLLKFNYSI